MKDDEVRILNRKIAGIYEELWEATGNELFRLSYEKTMRCGEVVKGTDGKGKHYNCHDPFCLRCNRRKKNENRKKTEYVLQNSKKKGNINKKQQRSEQIERNRKSRRNEKRSF